MPADTLKMGRFGHDTDPSLDFLMEVESIDEMHGMGADADAIRERIEQALDFRVGGSGNAIAAKDRLRDLAKKYAPSDAGAAVHAPRALSEQAAMACEIATLVLWAATRNLPVHEAALLMRLAGDVSPRQPLMFGDGFLPDMPFDGPAWARVGHLLNNLRNMTQ
jgi:hypothetical protein